MATYSLGTPPTNATNLNDITAVLNQLPDNTSKQITPKDVRDAVYTAWENIVFKPTGITSGEGYIGFDSGTNGLTHSKVYFGKRRFSGQDIMTSVLLNTSTDFFFFNNKSDSTSQYTRISILAGTDSSVLPLSPYIESRPVTGSTFSYIDLNIINNSTDSNGLYGGNINIGTDGNRGYTAGGYVSINGMIFPSYITPGSTQATALDGYVLKYNSNGYLSWESSVGTINGITSSGTVSISGSPVLINNQETNFLTESLPIIQPFGSIPAGYTFSNENIVEVVRKMLYPYLGPQISYVLNVTPLAGSYQTSGSADVVIELGNLGTFSYTYTFTKRTSPITTFTSTLPSPGVPMNVTTTGTLTISNTLADVSTFGTKTFGITVSDGTQSVSQNSTVNKVLPFFYGATTSVISAGSFVNTFAGKLTKNIKDKSDTIVPLYGNSVCIYFAYPSAHGLLTNILDENGFNVITAFTYSTISLSSPSGYWSNLSYRVYIYTGGGVAPTTTSVGMPPTYTTPVNYQFKF